MKNNESVNRMLDSQAPNIFSLSRKRVKKLFEMTDIGKEIFPLFPSIMEDLEFRQRIQGSIVMIRKTKQIRVITLEAWLVVDFILSNLLESGLDLSRFSDQNIKILPESFRQRLDLLEKLIENQNSKKPNPSKYLIYLPPKFKELIIKDKDFFGKYVEKEDQFYKENLPGIERPLIYDPDNSKFRNVNEGWLKYINKIDKNWFKSARKLNAVRNIAAHSLDESQIFHTLGILGENRLGEAKDMIIEMLTEIIGLKIP